VKLRRAFGASATKRPFLVPIERMTRSGMIHLLGFARVARCERKATMASASLVDNLNRRRRTGPGAGSVG
jgi:hypothetical protein